MWVGHSTVTCAGNVAVCAGVLVPAHTTCCCCVRWVGEWWLSLLFAARADHTQVGAAARGLVLAVSAAMCSLGVAGTVCHAGSVQRDFALVCVTFEYSVLCKQLLSWSQEQLQTSPQHA